MDETNTARRRFFRRAGIATLIGGLAAAIGTRAWARGGWRHGHGAPDADRMLKHLYVEIDATDEQKRKLEPIVKDALKDLMPLRDKLHAARGRAVELLTGDGVDRAALEALRADQVRLADEGSRRLSRAIADAAEVLTPAQRKDLAAHFSLRHRRWHG